jgi:hypothetical protein
MCSEYQLNRLIGGGGGEYGFIIHEYGFFMLKARKNVFDKILAEKWDILLAPK